MKQCASSAFFTENKMSGEFWSGRDLPRISRERRAHAGFSINRGAHVRAKQVGERLMLVRPRIGPKLHHTNWRVEERLSDWLRSMHLANNVLGLATRDFYRDIGVRQNRHLIPSLSMRLPRPKPRAYFDDSAAFVRPSRIPHKGPHGTPAAVELPGCRFRTACRTSSGMVAA